MVPNISGESTVSSKVHRPVYWLVDIISYHKHISIFKFPVYLLFQYSKISFK